MNRRRPLFHSPLTTFRFALLLFVSGALGFAGVGSAVVVPNAYAETSADGAGNSAPFVCSAERGQRHQIVYDGTEVGTGTIRELRFRQDEQDGFGFGPTDFESVVVQMSSTDAEPDGLSIVFADNVGVDPTTVFDGALTISSASTSDDPAPFDIVVPFSTPFSFDSASGKNLLLDVTVPPCAFQFGTFYDFARVEGDGASMVIGGADSSTGFTPVTRAPVVELVMTGCTPSDTVLCLGAGRFRVEADWRTPEGDVGQAHGVQLTAATGYFWFFRPANVEMVVKVLNACGFNQRYWVFAGGLTNVEVDLVVTDTLTGAIVSYANELSTPFQPIQDNSAFATCP